MTKGTRLVELIKVHLSLSFLLRAVFLVSPIAASASEGAIARCGAPKGTGYFFFDELMNPNGPEWGDDGISDGKMVLISLGDEWDIQFDDIVGAYGYRQDGAEVIPLGASGEKFTIGAFRGTYTDVFTFDIARKEVVWTSHKIGTAIPKVAIYHAACSFVSPSFREKLRK